MEITKIKGIDKLQNLDCLDLDDNRIMEINGLDKVINLTDLCLTNNRISNEKDLDNLKCLKKLNLLDLRGNKIPCDLNRAQLRYAHGDPHWNSKNRF